MTKNLFSTFPSIEGLATKMKGVPAPAFREVNGHIHTPYSFSAFENLKTIFSMARDEEIAVLGINDFYVTDGYGVFYSECLRNNIFPLFNIEFIGLMKKEQKAGIRINDPNNPGRIYFCGKGLDYPFSAGWMDKLQLDRVRKESQKQVRIMVDRLNDLITEVNPSLKITYEDVKNRYARELVRERHLAKAVRMVAMENFSTPDEQLGFIEKLYGGKKSKPGISTPAALENEIRSNLLKAGGAAFVPEDENSFMELEKIIKIIIKAGGIPCYPVLLDDPAGRFTEFESDHEKLFSTLSLMGIGCIELIPGRNDPAVLKDFVEFFNEKGFVITFGTEHNTPELVPLTVSARGGVPLDDTLKKIVWDGACVIAAHQYLRSQGRQGFVLDDGTVSIKQKESLSILGRIVIEYYLNRKVYEPGD
ncbi:MAG: hypothetical protein V1903_01820 [Bacteroidota bacterium]